MGFGERFDGANFKPCSSRQDGSLSAGSLTYRIVRGQALTFVQPKLHILVESLPRENFPWGEIFGRFVKTGTTRVSSTNPKGRAPDLGRFAKFQHDRRSCLAADLACRCLQNSAHRHDRFGCTKVAFRAPARMHGHSQARACECHARWPRCRDDEPSESSSPVCLSPSWGDDLKDLSPSFFAPQAKTPRNPSSAPLFFAEMVRARSRRWPPSRPDENRFRSPHPPLPAESPSLMGPSKGSLS